MNKSKLSSKTLVRGSMISGNKLALTVPQSGVYTVKLHSPSGRELFKREVSLESGTGFVSLDQLSSHQLVLLSVEGAGVHAVQKLILK